jgi:hypothetical protein
MVRNRFEQAIERQAGRVVAITDPTDGELTTLTVADVTGDEHP